LIFYFIAVGVINRRSDKVGRAQPGSAVGTPWVHLIRG